MNIKLKNNESYQQTLESIWTGLGIPKELWPNPKYGFTILVNPEQIEDIKKWGCGDGKN